MTAWTTMSRELCFCTCRFHWKRWLQIAEISWEFSLRGKSGLHQGTVPGNSRAGQPDGQRHREQTAFVRKGKGETVG